MLYPARHFIRMVVEWFDRRNWRLDGISIRDLNVGRSALMASSIQTNDHAMICSRRQVARPASGTQLFREKAVSPTTRCSFEKLRRVNLSPFGARHVVGRALTRKLGVISTTKTFRTDGTGTNGPWEYEIELLPD